MQRITSYISGTEVEQALVTLLTTRAGVCSMGVGPEIKAGCKQSIEQQQEKASRTGSLYSGGQVEQQQQQQQQQRQQKEEQQYGQAQQLPEEEYEEKQELPESDPGELRSQFMQELLDKNTPSLVCPTDICPIHSSTCLRMLLEEKYSFGNITSLEQEVYVYRLMAAITPKEVQAHAASWLPRLLDQDSRRVLFVFPSNVPPDEQEQCRRVLEMATL